MKMLVLLAALSLLFTACSDSDAGSASSDPSFDIESSELADAQHGAELTKEYGWDTDEDGERGTIADMKFYFHDTSGNDASQVYDKAVAVCVDVDAGNRTWKDVLEAGERGSLDDEVGTDDEFSASGALRVACGEMRDSDGLPWNYYAKKLEHDAL